MILILRAAVIALLFYFSQTVSVMGSTPLYAGPDDPAAVTAASQAVKLLGTNRGAIDITGKIIDIVGLDSVSISGKSVLLDKTLKELKAKKVGTEIQISLSGDVLFEFDKWDIRPEAEDSLFKITTVVKELKKKQVLIEGHTDSKGSEAYNLKLSRMRADSVKKWLIENSDLKQVQFETRGYGETKPVASNTLVDGSDSPEGRAKNRRVEITIKK